MLCNIYVKPCFMLWPIFIFEKYIMSGAVGEGYFRMQQLHGLVFIRYNDIE